MKVKEIRDILEMTNGRVFRVDFVKKSGETRRMSCRIGVTKHLKGGQSTLDGKENLMVVFDMQKKAYRCISLDKLISAKVDGVEMKF